MHSRSSESGVLKSVIAGTIQNTAQLAKSVYHSNQQTDNSVSFAILHRTVVKSSLNFSVCCINTEHKGVKKYLSKKLLEYIRMHRLSRGELRINSNYNHCYNTYAAIDFFLKLF